MTDQEFIEDTIKKKLQEAYTEILEHYGIESGDITPEQLQEIGEAEEEVVEKTVKWIGFWEN